MAQSGFTPIILYHSDTTTNVPTTIISGELAANTVDGKLFLGTGTNTYKTLLNVGSSTITVGGNLTFSGAFSTTLTVTGTTTGTLPTSGYHIATVTNMAANPVTGTPSSSNFLRGDGTWASASSNAITNGTSNVTVNTSGGTVTVTVAGTAATTVNTSGGFSVGTTADAGAGGIYATANITAYYSSDIKFKENVQDVPDALGIVTAIGSKTFDWTDEYLAEHGGEDEYFQPKQSFGVIAQDVQKVFPQAVRTRTDGSLAVDYEKLAILSFGAIGQLLKRVEALEAK